MRLARCAALAVACAVAGEHAVRRAVFEEVAPPVSGIRWVHDNALSEDRWLPEIMGSGCAFLDFDGDGWMDIYLVNSRGRNALYRNNRNGTFTDVTKQAGVGGDGIFGMGVAVGDFNNDGHPDLFITGAGRSILYRNNGNGTFSDVTAQSGLAMDGWTMSAAWFDADGDGLLDLFVCSYVPQALESRRSCPSYPEAPRFYCSPSSFAASRSLLYRNNGDGTFTEIGAGTAIGEARGKALGVVAADINQDGRMDLFVANDTERNHLFVNRGPDGAGKVRWSEAAIEAGVAYAESGRARGGMGVDAWDFEGQGWPDLFVANLSMEFFSLYRNLRTGSFEDVSGRGALRKVSRPLSGWGVKFFDYDNDGEADLFVAAGFPNDRIGLASPPIRFKEPLLLMHGEGGQLADARMAGGPAFTRAVSGRGVAVGDFNNDGRSDVLIALNGEAPMLLRNQSEARNHWLGISLRGTRCNRDAVGARVRWSLGGKVRSREKVGGGSYLSSQDPRLILGLGPSSKLDWLEVRWPAPGSRVQWVKQTPLDRYIEIVEER